MVKAFVLNSLLFSLTLCISYSVSRDTKIISIPSIKKRASHSLPPFSNSLWFYLCPSSFYPPVFQMACRCSGLIYCSNQSIWLFISHTLCTKMARCECWGFSISFFCPRPHAISSCTLLPMNTEYINQGMPYYSVGMGAHCQTSCNVTMNDFWHALTAK